MSGISFRPSDVVLHVPPLTGAMGKSEYEHAAACIVRVCQARGDEWQGVTFAMVKEVLQEDVAAGREPFASLTRNPFFRPDIQGLSAAGFCICDIADGKATLTDAGFRALSKHVRSAVEVP